MKPEARIKILEEALNQTVSALKTTCHDSGCHPSEDIHTKECIQRKLAYLNGVAVLATK